MMMMSNPHQKYAWIKSSTGQERKRKKDFKVSYRFNGIKFPECTIEYFFGFVKPMPQSYLAISCIDMLFITSLSI